MTQLLKIVISKFNHLLELIGGNEHFKIIKENTIGNLLKGVKLSREKSLLGYPARRKLLITVLLTRPLCRCFATKGRVLINNGSTGKDYSKGRSL